MYPTIQKMGRQALASSILLLCATAALAQSAQHASCKLRYPIVLSHHFSMRPLCAATAPATGPASCMNSEDYQRYCAAKATDAQGKPSCDAWRVPADEESLPPRNTNATDPTLHRDARGFHRYFSKEIVDMLRGTCGNAVYIADKPAYASYEVRARSLRNTVNEALAGEHAQKVILVGLSQGVQDARYMTAVLPVDDNQPALGRMTARVAALVSLSGEDGGAESASLALGTFSLLNGGDWSDYQKVIKLVGEEAVNDSSWKRGTSDSAVYVMGEQCRGDECDMNLEARYRSAMHALYNLGTDFMRPSPFQRSAAQTARWKKLQAYVGDPALRWSDVVPPELEADNGVSYISYGARIHNWSPAWGDVFSMDFLFFTSIVLTDGANDGYVSTRRQVFANPAANFEHVRTLSGAWWGKGYHHMFFSGRNDKLYAPAVRDRDAAPYDGDAAGFYRQMARDLKARGF